MKTSQLSLSKETLMYGKVAGTSTLVTGAAGVKMLPNTGGTRIMFIVSLITLTLGLITLLIATHSILKRRISDFLYS